MGKHVRLAQLPSHEKSIEDGPISGGRDTHLMTDLYHFCPIRDLCSVLIDLAKEQS